MRSKRSRRSSTGSKVRDYEFSANVSLFPMQASKAILPPGKVELLLRGLMSAEMNVRQNAVLLADAHAIRFKAHSANNKTSKRAVRKDTPLTSVIGYHEIDRATVGLAIANGTMREYQVLGFNTVDDYRNFLLYLGRHEIRAVMSGWNSVESDGVSISSRRSSLSQQYDPMRRGSSSLSTTIDDFNDDGDALVIANVDCKIYNPSVNSSSMSQRILQDMTFQGRLDRTGKLMVQRARVIFTCPTDAHYSWSKACSSIARVTCTANDSNHLVLQIMDRMGAPLNDVLLRFKSEASRDQAMQAIEQEMAAGSRSVSPRRGNHFNRVGALVTNLNRMRPTSGWNVGLYPSSTAKQYHESANEDFVHFQVKTQEPQAYKAIIHSDRVVLFDRSGMKNTQKEVEFRSLRDQVLFDDHVLLVLKEESDAYTYKLLQFNSPSDAKAFLSQIDCRTIRGPAVARPRPSISLEVPRRTSIVDLMPQLSVQSDDMAVSCKHYPMHYLNGRLPATIIKDMENDDILKSSFGILRPSSTQLQYLVNKDGVYVASWVASYALIHRVYVFENETRQLVIARKDQDERPDHYTLVRFQRRDDKQMLLDYLTKANCSINVFANNRTITARDASQLGLMSSDADATLSKPIIQRPPLTLWKPNSSFAFDDTMPKAQRNGGRFMRPRSRHSSMERDFPDDGFSQSSRDFDPSDKRMDDGMTDFYSRPMRY